MFDDAEVLFPSKMVHFKASNINCVTETYLDNIDLMCDASQGESTTKVEHHIHNNNLVTPGGLTKMLSLDVIHSKD